MSWTALKMYIAKIIKYSHTGAPRMTKLSKLLSGRPGHCDVTTIYTTFRVDAPLELSICNN